MTTVQRSPGQAFAIWVTGLPASGKSTLVAALKVELNGLGVDIAILESDVLREIFTPHPTYDEAERALFYRQMRYVGKLLIDHGVPVIFDATANRRAYRDAARAEISRFLEVYVHCPLELCINRDPKGIYQRAREHQSHTVPGVQSFYEPPENPDVTISSERDATEDAANRIVAKLVDKGYL